MKIFPTQKTDKGNVIFLEIFHMFSPQFGVISTPSKIDIHFILYVCWNVKYTA